MIRGGILLLLVVLVGCFQGGPPIDPSTGITSSSTGPEAPSSVKAGLLGPATTRGAFIELFANVSGSMNLRLVSNGTVVFQGSITDANRTWNLTLDPGRTAIRLEVISRDGAVHWLNATRLMRTRLEIDYCHFHPSTPDRKVERYEVWIDLQARPSGPEYRTVAASRPDRFNAHDQLRQWSNESRVPIVVSYSASLEGFSLDKVDGVGNPVSASAPPYWLLYRNGENADVGMTLMPVKPNDEIAWRLC